MLRLVRAESIVGRHVTNKNILRRSSLVDCEILENFMRKTGYLGHILRGEHYNFQRLILQGKIEKRNE